MEPGLIVGIVAGCAAVLFLIVTVGFKLIRYIQRELDKEEGDSAHANTSGLPGHVIAFTLPHGSFNETRGTRAKMSFASTPVVHVAPMTVVDLEPGNPFEHAPEQRYVGVTPGYLRKSTDSRRRLRKSKRKARV